MYTPNPIKTDHITLTDDLLELVERLAENVHENWAQTRMQEGWVYGEQRDDAKKTTPCLVAYGDLPDSEKTYDRVTATETIKTLLALGYTIHKN